MLFLKLVSHRRKSPVPKYVLALDPGHTTGWCLFHEGQLKRWGQAETIKETPRGIEYNWKALEELFTMVPPDALEIVCEEYLIYKHKLSEHTYSKVLTLRIIGTIQYLCWRNNLPLRFHNASRVKSFCNNVKLKQWGFYQKGMRHARDAIRHACYYILFGGD